MSDSRMGSGRAVRKADRRCAPAVARSLVGALAAISAGAAIDVPAARAGSFEVSQCNALTDNGTAISGASAGYQSALWNSGGASSFLAGCTGTGDFLNITHPNFRLHSDETAGHGLHLPAGMANTTIRNVDASFIAHAQAPSTNPAYLMMKSGGTTLESVTTDTVIWPKRYTPPAGSRNVEFYMWCSPANGPGYCNWSAASWTLRALTLRLEESALPSADASGPLLSGGEQAGIRPVDITASDADSGVKKVAVTLDGVNVGSFDFAASCSIDRLRPCPPDVLQSLDVDTTKVADGSRLLRLVATDRAGNTRTVNKGYLIVENVPPPASITQPTVTGEKRLNRTLSGDKGTWTGDGITYSYRWQRYEDGAWANVPDATALSHSTTSHDVGKRLRLKVTATNIEGSTDAYSDVTDPIAAPGATDADGDFDSDGILNDVDADDDGDGVDDVEDAAPFDSDNPKDAPGADFDGDGIPNRTDADDDGDGIADYEDASPYDPAISAPDSATVVPETSTGPAPAFNTDNGAGASPRAALAARFADSRARRVKARFGQTRRITGTLLTADGKPIAGARLDVISHTLAMGARPAIVAQVVTDANGRYSYTIPSGPSRRISVAYRWYLEASSHTHTTTVRVDVVPRVTLKVDRTALRNKQAVRFAGKVAGAPRGARKVVELEALDGRIWRTFATARLARNGTFTYSYRFKRTTRPTNYRFRARVKAEQGWPFLTGQSRPAKVSVRP